MQALDPVHQDTHGACFTSELFKSSMSQNPHAHNMFGSRRPSNTAAALLTGITFQSFTVAMLPFVREMSVNTHPRVIAHCAPPLTVRRPQYHSRHCGTVKRDCVCSDQGHYISKHTCLWISLWKSFCFVRWGN